jgi:uncharacterized membrane protein
MAQTKRTAHDRPSDEARQGEHGVSGHRRLLAALVTGVAGAVIMGVFEGWTFAPLAGWDGLCAVLVGATWVSIWPRDAEETARHAVREDPARALTDVLLVLASCASLLGVAFLVVAGGNTHGAEKGFLVGLAVATVVLGWSVVHTTFTLRYARLYYSGPDGGIEFNTEDNDPPKYSDFAYVAFTIGMTFQVSDTNLTSKTMRATALRHALLAYLFGVVIIAVMINLVAGLSK